jgi:hypothetical protein
MAFFSRASEPSSRRLPDSVSKYGVRRLIAGQAIRVTSGADRIWSRFSLVGLIALMSHS